jgi:hypothetical protein
MNASPPSVAILLSTFNGERYLPDQLASFIAQTHTDWLLYWRDDGSSDGTHSLMAAFCAEAGAGRCITDPAGGRLRATRSFLMLLRMALRGQAALFAFSDQDDVWLPEKLAHGVAALTRVRADVPGLYVCARTPVDATLRPVGHPVQRAAAGFPGSLTENVAPGCCMLLNRAAAALIDVVTAPEDTWHDWWAYIVVSACDGAIITEGTPDILYRQHENNLVGEPRGFWRRIIAAAGRGRRPFMARLWRHVAALRASPSALTARARTSLNVIERARSGGLPARIEALRLPGFNRQGWLETWLFRLMFLLG